MLYQNKLVALLAVNQDNVLGVGNHLPWYDKEDMEFFKLKTKRGICIVGYNTYLTLPTLSDRLLLVQTSRVTKPTKHLLGGPGMGKTPVILFDVLTEELIEEARSTYFNHYNISAKDELFLIGGGQIYNNYFNYVDEWYLTVLNKDVSMIPGTVVKVDSVINRLSERLRFNYQNLMLPKKGLGIPNATPNKTRWLVTNKRYDELQGLNCFSVDSDLIRADIEVHSQYVYAAIRDIMNCGVSSDMQEVIAEVEGSNTPGWHPKIYMYIASLNDYQLDIIFKANKELLKKFGELQIPINASGETRPVDQGIQALHGIDEIIQNEETHLLNRELKVHLLFMLIVNSRILAEQFKI